MGEIRGAEFTHRDEISNATRDAAMGAARRRLSTRVSPHIPLSDTRRGVITLGRTTSTRWMDVLRFGLVEFENRPATHGRERDSPFPHSRALLRLRLSWPPASFQREAERKPVISTAVRLMRGRTRGRDNKARARRIFREAARVP